MAFPGTGLETIIHSRELGGRNININILSNVPIVRKRKKNKFKKATHCHIGNIQQKRQFVVIKNYSFLNYILKIWCSVNCVAQLMG